MQKCRTLNGDQRAALRETREIRRTHETHETDKTYKTQARRSNEQTETDRLQVRTPANARRNQLAGEREPTSRPNHNRAARIPLRDDSHRLQPSDRPDCSEPVIRDNPFVGAGNIHDVMVTGGIQLARRVLFDQHARFAPGPCSDSAIAYLTQYSGSRASFSDQLA